MSRLAKQHRVIHMDFGISLPVTFAARALRHDPSLLFKPKRLWSEGIIRREGAGNLSLGSSWGPPGLELLPHTSSVRDHFQYDAKVSIVQQYLEREGIKDAIIWVYHPGFGEAALRLVLVAQRGCEQAIDVAEQGRTTGGARRGLRPHEHRLRSLEVEHVAVLGSDQQLQSTAAQRIACELLICQFLGAG